MVCYIVKIAIIFWCVSTNLYIICVITPVLFSFMFTVKQFPLFCCRVIERINWIENFHDTWKTSCGDQITSKEIIVNDDHQFGWSEFGIYMQLVPEINCFPYTFIFMIYDFKVLHVRETINKFTLFPDHWFQLGIYSSVAKLKLQMSGLWPVEPQLFVLWID